MTEASGAVENPTVEKTSSPETPSNEGKMGTASVWVDLAKLKAFRSTLKLQGTTSLSQELNQFFDKRTAEIKGLATPNGPNSKGNSDEAELQRRQVYDLAKRRVFELHVELIKMIKFFREARCWNNFLQVFCRDVDCDKTFEPPSVNYGAGRGEEGYDNYCTRFIEEASDREDFKQKTIRFVLRNRDNQFVSDWLIFVEKLKERRKLSRQLLMYQLDSLSDEERLQLQKEDAERKEANRLGKGEEAKAREQRRLEEEERERKQREEEDRSFGEDDQDEEDEGEDIEEEEDEEDEFVVEPPVITIATEEKEESPCTGIVPLGETK
jgi:hypothetical protein